MDIAAMSMAMSHAHVKQQATLSVMDKAIDQSQADSQGLIKMMEQSVQPHLGNSINSKA